MSQDFEQLTVYSKSFTGLTPDKEALLVEIGPQIKPHLAAVTDEFYQQLLSISEASTFLAGRVETLKKPMPSGWKVYSQDHLTRILLHRCSRLAMCM